MAERTLRIEIWIAAVFSMLVAGPAAAGCISNNTQFDLAANQTHSSRITVTKRGCVRSFTGGLRVTYESITVTERPRHMRIEPTSNGFGYRLTVPAGYKGDDRYAIRACGVGPTGRGCVTITYIATIQ